MQEHARMVEDVSVSGVGLDPTLNTPRTIKFWLITVVYRVTTPTTTPTQNVRTLTTQNTSVYYLPSLIPRYHVTKDVEILQIMAKDGV